jgi:hypothetical protein
MKDQLVNMSEPRERGMLLDYLRTLEGMHRVNVVRFRPRRTDRQNRYYWPVFVQTFVDYLEAQGCKHTPQEVHEMFRHKFLQTNVKIVDEMWVNITRSTTELATAEFNKYLDDIAMWLADMFHIVLPGPSVYREVEGAA